MIYNTLHRKLKSNTNTAKSGDDNMCSGKVRSSFSTNGNSTNITNLNNHLSPQLTQNIVLKRLQEQKYIGVNGLPDPLSHTPKWVSMCVCVFRVSIFPLFQWDLYGILELFRHCGIYLCCFHFVTCTFIICRCLSDFVWKFKYWWQHNFWLCNYNILYRWNRHHILRPETSFHTEGSRCHGKTRYGPDTSFYNEGSRCHGKTRSAVRYDSNYNRRFYRWIVYTRGNYSFLC